jgi:hypothetical protein
MTDTISDKRPKIKRNALQCAHCLSIIESVHRHDFKYCACGRIFIDGGKDYVRYGAKSFDDVIVLTEYEDE